LRDRQPETRAVRLRREERFSHSAEKLRHDSRSIIRNAHAHDVGARFDRHTRTSAGRHRLGGIQEKVEEELLERSGVPTDDDRTVEALRDVEMGAVSGEGRTRGMECGAQR
jgi:hypothetical protein